jgi:holo-[acyl-carrier protein] synthase
MLVGIDLVDVREVAEAIRTRGDRYLRRLFSDAELGYCGSDAALLAAFIAAKEAAMKALRVADEPISWTSIEVRKPASQTCLKLTGVAAELARRRGVLNLRVSLSHRDGVAVAIVMGHTGLMNDAMDADS